MPAADIIKSENVLCNARARSKKHCLEILSELLAQSSPDIANEEIFARLVERERLGCTGLSKGVAFPRCRVSGATKSSGALIKLSEPVDFDAIDGELVDIVFGLMIPEELDSGNLGDIKLITSLLSDPAVRASLRQANSSRSLYDVLLAGIERFAAVTDSSNAGPDESDIETRADE
ncbi:MAG: PTS sugar transporter subunit IIA [Gammaproteobacteria bacterium]|nr:PTS sugar transporter subunit IIA [Gammaproteobacteria bacterium]MDH4315145.1 PTS sugar transporter subunit IIA [Gammaproteobacteria bacterium]MDH5213598.1 PTS sugar transporter subunit IIA [Gammaproteobacteria bacterium]MDH5500335.1 PTS sugar transporter subunit IIA [Gammaproteobacteria bacterium]